VSLSGSAIALVAGANVLVFGVGLAWLTGEVGALRRADRGLVEELVIERLQSLLDTQGNLRARGILDWSRWDTFEDALIVELAEFAPDETVLEELRHVSRAGGPSAVRQADCVPLARPDGALWGVAWVPSDAASWAGRFPVGWLAGTRVLFADRRRPPARWRAPAGGFQRAEMQLALARGERRLVDRAIFLPLRSVTGEPLGAAHVPMRDWDRRGPLVFGALRPPWCALLPVLPAPQRLFDGAEVLGLPHAGFGPQRAPRGAFFNPVGLAHRTATFDERDVLTDIRLAAFEGREVQTERGTAVPVRLPSGRVWGGCWLQRRERLATGGLVARFLPWFVLSTLALTLTTFVVLRRLVLGPVRRLARGARRIAGGDLGVRVREPRRDDELADLVKSFNDMAGQVQDFNARLAREVEIATSQAREAEAAAMTQRRLAATGELAAGIAHEINNPLGGMLNAVEALRGGDVVAGRRDAYLGLVQGGLERIRTTVGQLLRLAPRATRTTSVSLATPISDALGLVAHRAQRENVTIRVGGPGGMRPATDPAALEALRALPPVRGQENELGQAVLNLFVNALDALEAKGGGAIDLSLSRAGDELHLWIEDDGPGADQETLARAADLFFTTKDAGQGTGLGLAIVHNVVATHGGTVRLSSAPGHGFRVDVRLPIAPEERA
jgi:signal transduction histidine kinase